MCYRPKSILYELQTQAAQQGYRRPVQRTEHRRNVYVANFAIASYSLTSAIRSRV